MLIIFLQSLALFVPILAANQAGHVVKLFGLPDAPTCVRLFGKNKTLMPFLVGPVLSMLVLVLYRDPFWLQEGFVLGIGAIIAEHIKSLFKRLLGFKEGAPFFFDRIDFAIGGSIAVYLYFSWVTVEHVLCIVAIAYPLHVVGNRFSYHMGWRKTPH